MAPYISLLTALLVALSSPAWAGFWDSATSALQQMAAPPAKKEAKASPSVSNSEMEAGFRQALELAVEQAVKSGGAPGGFLDNPRIRIPLPSHLQTAASLMRNMGMGGQVDALETTMNHAAEKAVAGSMPIFAKALKEITFQDLMGLYRGGDTAITDYFKRKTWKELYAKFLPVVHQSAMEVGVTRRYEEMASNPMVRPMIQGTSLDLDHYVATKALDGLFTLMAQQEAQIRRDPAARTTDLLKKVFGTLTSSRR